VGRVANIADACYVPRVASEEFSKTK
jgi:hypothetical protein